MFWHFKDLIFKTKQGPKSWSAKWHVRPCLLNLSPYLEVELLMVTYWCCRRNNRVLKWAGKTGTLLASVCLWSVYCSSKMAIVGGLLFNCFTLPLSPPRQRWNSSVVDLKIAIPLCRFQFAGHHGANFLLLTATASEQIKNAFQK